MIQIVATYRVDHWKDFLGRDLLEGITTILRQNGLNTVKTAYHTFSGNEGLTYVWILAESHFILHTYEEFHTVFVDLFSCKENQSVEDLYQLIHNIGRIFEGVVCDRKIIRRQVA